MGGRDDSNDRERWEQLDLADAPKIELDPEAWDEFMAFLEAPPEPNPRLRALMQRTDPPDSHADGRE